MKLTVAKRLVLKAHAMEQQWNETVECRKDGKESMMQRATTTSQIRPPAGFAHADYTDMGGRETVQQHMGADAESLLCHPCAIVHVRTPDSALA